MNIAVAVPISDIAIVAVRIRTSNYFPLDPDRSHLAMPMRMRTVDINTGCVDLTIYYDTSG